jgi:hypothetical protein
MFHDQMCEIKIMSEYAKKNEGTFERMRMKSRDRGALQVVGLAP